MEDRILVGLRIETGVIAEGPLAASLAWLDVAFEDDVGAGGHFEIHTDALHHLDSPA